jgi:hypothetical protein
MKLDKQTLARIEALAGRAGNTAFRQRKHDLIAECLRLLESGGNPDRHLAHEEMDALCRKFGGGGK